MLLQQAIATVVVCHCGRFWGLFAAQVNGYPFGALGTAHFNPGDAI
jgi:hypothetical protein